MKAINLNDLAVFAEVARAKGFRAAAHNLNLGAGSVSETIQRIEQRLGVRLIERTTRKISLTQAGEQLFERCTPALSDLSSALEDIGENPQTIAGTLRLSAPRSSSPFFLDEAIAKFGVAYPDVGVEIMYDDAKVDLVTSGIDAAIRAQTLLEKDTHAVEVGPVLDMALVAAPSYLARVMKPKTPQDLTQHDGIQFAFGRADQLAPWTFIDGKGAPFTVSPKSRMVVNDLVSMIQLARAGLGFAYVYKRPALPHIQSGELVALFDRKVPALPRYTINYLTKRHMPARLRAFIDLAKQSSQR